MIDITLGAFAALMAVLAILTGVSVLIEYISSEVIDRRISAENEPYNDDDWEDEDEF